MNRIVGLGQLQVSADPADTLTAYGLGSCIGVVLHAPEVGAWGLAHVVLPDAQDHGPDPARPVWFADHAVPAIRRALARLGVQPHHRIDAILVGGAHVVSCLDGFEIGERNADAVEASLRRAGLHVLGREVGGEEGRTIRIHIAGGDVDIETRSGGIETLYCAGPRTFRHAG